VCSLNSTAGVLVRSLHVCSLASSITATRVASYCCTHSIAAVAAEGKKALTCRKKRSRPHTAIVCTLVVVSIAAIHRSRSDGCAAAGAVAGNRSIPRGRQAHSAGFLFNLAIACHAAT